MIADPDPTKGKIKKTIKEFSKEWTGILLLPTPKESYSPTREKVAGLSSFAHYLATKRIGVPYRFSFSLYYFFLVLVVLIIFKDC